MVAVGIAFALMIRGWRRGLVREAVEMGVLIVGTIVVFRMSPPVGSVISAMANLPYEVGRMIGGILMFFVLVIGGFFVARLIAAALKIVPGATSMNRLGGAALGGSYAIVIVALVTTLVSAAPLPDSARESVDRALEDSTVVGIVATPGGPVQSSIGIISGERIFAAVIAVDDAVGHRLAAGTIPIPIPDTGDESLAPSQASAQLVFDELNRHRISAGVDPLIWSSELATVAVSRAQNVYRSGFLTLDDDLGAALKTEGVPGTIHDEMLAIAATPHGLIEAISSASAYADILTDPAYRISGVGVIEGPYGLIAVQVVSG